MPPVQRLHRFAAITAGITFLLLIVGGLVHGTGSSLACPDWPLCHGQFFPRMEKGVEYEHTHRLVAGAVAILTVLLSAWIFREKQARSLRPLAIAAPIMVLAQAVLGGITVLYRLPIQITLSHLVLSMCFFSVLLVIAVRTRAIAHPGGDLAKLVGQPTENRFDLRAFVAIVAVAILGQMFLGGLVRHSMAGLACTTWLDCFGSYWPAESSSSHSERIHMLHRFGAATVGMLVLTHGALVWRRFRGSKEPGAAAARSLAIGAVIVVLLQITLGVLSVTSLLHLYTVTAHLGCGALLLATHVILWAVMPGHRWSLSATKTVENKATTRGPGQAAEAGAS